MPRHKKLKKQLTLLDLFAIATGTMISSGFFLLPGIAAGIAGPAVIAAFFLAGIVTIPTLLSQAELAAAMPKSGGTYYFLDRSMGPLAGTIGGFGTWLALMFKGGFGLIGFGAYMGILLAGMGLHLSEAVLVLILAIPLTILNILGTKKSGRMQLILVFGILALLGFFGFAGIPQVKRELITPFMPHGISSLLATIGLVFISYAGLTKIASVAEEVKKPARDIPLAMGLSLVTVMTVYTIGVTVMVGVIPMERLSRTLTPATDAAHLVMGPVGTLLVTLAATLAFISCANAGLLSASRYPFAMARDRLLPHFLRRIGSRRTPYPSILLTSLIMLIMVFSFDVASFAKLASTFQLLLFASVNFALIIMRESGIEDYTPEFRSPFYPWMQILGVLFSFGIIAMLGMMEILFSVGVIIFGILWYLFYASHQVGRVGAWTRIVDRVTRRETTPLDLISELREIQKERGLKEGDPFEDMVERAPIIDLKDDEGFEALYEQVGEWIQEEIGIEGEKLKEEFLLRNRIGETPAEKGVAIPHIRLDACDTFHLILGRSKKGLELAESPDPIHVIFVLIGCKAHTALHIRVLAELARRADQEEFVTLWKSARDTQTLRRMIEIYPFDADVEVEE